MAQIVLILDWISLWDVIIQEYHYNLPDGWFKQKMTMIFSSVLWQVTLLAALCRYRKAVDSQVRGPAIKKFYGQPIFFCQQNIRTMGDFNHHRCPYRLSRSFEKIRLFTPGHFCVYVNGEVIWWCDILTQSYVMSLECSLHAMC